MSLTCENCGYEMPASDCRNCGESVPRWAKFCPHCGEGQEAAKAVQGEGDPLLMENRRACPDGNCIGILGADGRCIICGSRA